MPIADDFSIASNGDIRYTGTGDTHTVIAFHRFLQDKADEGSILPTSDDFLDITDDTPSDRSTDNIITLINGYNIDDTAAQYLYDGSIEQDGGATRYSGLVVVGSVEAGTELQIIQNGDLLRNYWGSGLNADAGANILLRIMVKTIENSVPIDGGRILVVASEYGDTRSEFSATLGLGNGTAAIFTGNDLNNTAGDLSTIEGYTDITVQEGFRLIDVDNDTVPEEYYGEWTYGANGINDLYERAKWYQRRPLNIVDPSAATGTDYTVDNATITGQAQSFTARAGISERLTSVVCSLRASLTNEVALPGTVYCELYSSTGSPLVPDALLATSEEVLANLLTTTYADVEFVFNSSDFANNSLDLTASADYCIVIRHPDGTATDFVQVEGSASSTIAGNQAQFSGTWTGNATQDLNVGVRTSPILYNSAGVLHRGVTHSFGYGSEIGSPTLATNDEFVFGTVITLNGGITGNPIIGEAVRHNNATPNWRGELLAFDDTLTDDIIVIRLTSGTVSTTETIIFEESGATATVSTGTAPDNPVTPNTGGRMRLLAVDDNTGTGDFYIQLLAGTVPSSAGEDLRCSWNGTEPELEVGVVTSTGATSRTVSSTFIGNSTGSALIGAYGVGVETADLTDSDLLIDLNGDANQPPITATFTVTGMDPDALSIGGRLLVAPRTGTAINTTFSLIQTTSLTGIATSVEVDAVPTYAPASGKIRIVDDVGRERLVDYASRTTGAGGVYTFTTPVNAAATINANATTGTFTRTTGDFIADGFLPGQQVLGSGFPSGGNNALFTIDSVTATVITVTDPTGMITEIGDGNELLTVQGYDFTNAADGSTDNASTGNGVYLAYLDADYDTDQASFALINPGTLPLFVRFRDGRPASAIKTFENAAAQITNSGGSATVIRTPDI